MLRSCAYVEKQREWGLTTEREIDQLLVERVQRGDKKAFELLVIKYQRKLMRLVSRLVRDQAEAEDVVQEAFLHAYQSLHSFKGDSLFFTWLYRIAVNTAISMKRKKRLVQRIQPTGEGGNTIEPVDPSETNRPGHAMEMAEEERRVHKALQKLSAEHRAVLVMKDMEGMKYEAMADILGVPVGTIRSRLHRARLEIRDILLQTEQHD